MGWKSRRRSFGPWTPLPVYRPVWCERLTQIPLKRGSIDCVLSLAGLHHSMIRRPVFAEFHRLLKPGGRLVVADVRDGSPVAQWLDSEVDRWSETGHRGDFFSGATRSALSACGFEVQAWTPVQIGWRFASAAEMGAFCKSLFGLTRASEGDVIESLRSWLGTHERPGECTLRWELLYGTALRV